MRFPRLKNPGFLAGVSVVSMVCLLPVLEFLEANQYFRFRYGFDERLLGLVLLVFGVVPLLAWTLLARHASASGRSLAWKIGLGAALLLFVSQLYSTSLRERAPLLHLGMPALSLLVGGLLILRWRRELLWSLALGSVAIVPFMSYQLLRHWWWVPKPPKQEVHVTLEHPQNDIYLLFIDGCTVTSDHLDTEHYPDARLFPNLHRFLREDAQWFYNSVSNGSWTAASLPSMFSGKLYASRRTNYLANEPSIFTILKPLFSIRAYLFTKSCFCIHEDFHLCYPFRNQDYFEPMRILVQSYVHISSFRLARLGYSIGMLDQTNYRREDMVGDFLAHAARDDESTGFYAIQLFDRGQEGLQSFDAFLGQLLEILKSHGRYDRSIIALVSDHGYNLEGAKMSYGVKARPTRQLYHVPFAIKTPGHGQGHVYDYPAQGIDITPTILAQVLSKKDLGGLAFDGVDVLTSRPKRDHYVNMLVSGVMYKFVDDGPAPELVAVPVSEIPQYCGRHSENETTGAAEGEASFDTESARNLPAGRPAAPVAARASHSVAGRPGKAARSPSVSPGPG